MEIRIHRHFLHSQPYIWHKGKPDRSKSLACLMTCDVIEVTTRRGKREEEGFVGLHEGGREQQERRWMRRTRRRRGGGGVRGSCWPWPLLGGWVKRLSKQVTGSDNNHGCSAAPRPRVSAGIPTAFSSALQRVQLLLGRGGVGGWETTSFTPLLPPSPPREHRQKTEPPLNSLVSAAFHSIVIISLSVFRKITN